MLSVSDAEKLVHAFMTSRLDYCNALLGGCPASSINKLQIVQNAAARVLTRSRKYDHITPNLNFWSKTDRLLDWWTDVGQILTAAGEHERDAQQNTEGRVSHGSGLDINYRRSSDIRSCWGTQTHDSFIRYTRTETSLHSILYTPAQTAELRCIHVFNIFCGNYKRLGKSMI